MADFKIIKLHFTTPLHISYGKDDYGKSDQIIHSDTIKSAIFVNALNLFGNLITKESFLEKFNISSCFPFYADEYFFPKPMVRLPFKIGNSENEEAKANKKLKKMHWFGKSYFEKLIGYIGDYEKENQIQISNNHFISNGEFVTDYNELINKKDGDKFEFIQSHIHQRVNIPRNTSEESKPYYVDRLYFAEKSGLYFIIDCKDANIYKQVIGSLKLLGDTGIGTDKNVGNGLFEFEERNISLKIPDNSNKQMALSLYCPLKEEIEKDLDKSAYSLIKRGGYIANPSKQEHSTLRKKSVYMFAEGSVFPNSENRTGNIVNLKPEIEGDWTKIEHEIWRDGRAIFINIKTEN